jgi:hypothetical protein
LKIWSAQRQPQRLGVSTKQQNVENAKKMTEDEKKFSFLFSSFVYKKEKNSSDSLMKKLVELMEKDSQKKRDDEIVVEEVSPQLEHTIEIIKDDYE